MTSDLLDAIAAGRRTFQLAPTSETEELIGLQGGIAAAFWDLDEDVSVNSVVRLCDMFY